jgi:hypothetical protein
VNRRKGKPGNLLSIIERVKDVVKRLKGQLSVTAYLPGERDYFRIEYDPEQDRGLYAKYTSCAGDQRETVEEFWPSRMYDVFSTPGVVVCVEFKGHDSKWFDTNEDPKSASQMFHFIMKQTAKRS